MFSIKDTEINNDKGFWESLQMDVTEMFDNQLWIGLRLVD